jgi:ABC-type multidrug transport system fused ATPase/permease subunit
LSACATLIAWLRGSATAGLVRHTSRELLDGTYRHLLRLPLPFFHGRPVEDLVLRLQGADVVLDEVLDDLMAALSIALVAVTALVALLALYPQESAVVIAAALVLGGLTWLAQRASPRRLHPRHPGRLAAVSIRGLASERIAEIKMIGVSRFEPSWFKHLEERLDARRERKRQSDPLGRLLSAAQLRRLAPRLGEAAHGSRSKAGRHWEKSSASTRSPAFVWRRFRRSLLGRTVSEHGGVSETRARNPGGEAGGPRAGVCARRFAASS